MFLIAFDVPSKLGVCTTACSYLCFFIYCNTYILRTCSDRSGTMLRWKRT